MIHGAGAVFCRTEADLLFFKKIIEKYKLRTNLFNIDFLIANEQYPVVLYIYDEEIAHSNLEYYYWRESKKRYESFKLIDINILKRKEKLEKINGNT